jgi:hypothetical protein
VSGLERVADPEVPTEANETHVHNACRACQYVTGDVNIAPCYSERPVPCVNNGAECRPKKRRPFCVLGLALEMPVSRGTRCEVAVIDILG